MNLIAYIAYFRSLAIAHKDIQHNAGSEVGDAPIESKKFEKWNAEEVVRGDLRTKMSFTPAALLLELYDTDLQSSNVYDIKQKPRGAFTVLCKSLPKDSVDEERAYGLAEVITYDLLQKIWADHYGPDHTLCNTPFHRFFFDKITITPVGPLYDNCVGFRTEFEFEFHQVMDIKTGPDAGVFLPINLLGGDDYILADGNETLSN